MFNKADKAAAELINDETWQRNADRKVAAEQLNELVAQAREAGIDSPGYASIKGQMENMREHSRTRARYMWAYALNNAAFLALPALLAVIVLFINVLKSKLVAWLPYDLFGLAHSTHEGLSVISGVSAAIMALLLLARVWSTSQFMIAIGAGLTAVVMGFGAVVSADKSNMAAQLPLWWAATIGLVCLAIGMFMLNNSMGIFSRRSERGNNATGFPVRIRRRWTLATGSAFAACALSFVAMAPGVTSSGTSAVDLASATPREAPAIAAAREILPLVQSAVVGAHSPGKVYERLAEGAVADYLMKSPRIGAIAKKYNVLVVPGATPTMPGTDKSCPGVSVVPAAQRSEVTVEDQRLAQEIGGNMALVGVVARQGVGHAVIAFGDCKSAGFMLGRIGGGESISFKRQQTPLDAATLKVELFR